MAAAVYAVRCFGVAAGFHRYFSHRAFRTSRPFQFVLAVLGTLAMQKGVLWWTATHRRHHRSPRPGRRALPAPPPFAYSHCGWFLDPANRFVELGRVRDLMRYRELVWLDRWRIVPILLLAAGLWALGPTVFVWAFCVGTVALWHATLSTGSFSHRVGGYRNFDTPDDSRNNRVIAVVLLGEGWHNNHHRSPARPPRHAAHRARPDPRGAAGARRARGDQGPPTGPRRSGGQRLQPGAGTDDPVQRPAPVGVERAERPLVAAPPPHPVDEAQRRRHLVPCHVEGAVGGGVEQPGDHQPGVAQRRRPAQAAGEALVLGGGERGQPDRQDLLLLEAEVALDEPRASPIADRSVVSPAERDVELECCASSSAVVVAAPGWRRRRAGNSTSSSARWW